MPLPLPRLDRLTYRDLVTEARDSIARNAPGWTDHNAHDPGITLIELLSWLVESDSYRLDRVPEEAYRVFLRLAGVEPQPAQVAETVLVLSLTEQAASMVTSHLTQVTMLDLRGFKNLVGLNPAANEKLPSMSLTKEFQAQTGDGAIVFQTTRDLFVSSAKLDAVISISGGERTDMTDFNHTAKAYLPLGISPKVDDALYLGFDRMLGTSAETISLYCWTTTPEADRETRKRLQAEQQAAAARQFPQCPATELPSEAHYGAGIRWEYYAQAGVWKPLQNVADETRALTLSGAVRFSAPADHASGGFDGATATGYFIRCRLAEGGYDCPPTIVSIALNAVVAKHSAEVADAETLAETSRGQALQTYSLPRAPVVAGSTKLTMLVKGTQEGNTVELSSAKPSPEGQIRRERIWLRGEHPQDSGQDSPETLGWVRGNQNTKNSQLKSPHPSLLPEGEGAHAHKSTALGFVESGWHEAPSWDGVGPHDRIYVLQPESGEIRFGDGRVGRVPPAGASLSLNYQVGGGVSGNVAKESLTLWRDDSLKNSPVTLSQPFPAIGGAAAETLDEAKARAFAGLNEISRAVTLADIETLAQNIPGVPVARAYALADYDSRLPCLVAPDTVTVVVLSPCPEQKPVPSDALIQAVWRYLNARRLVTTQIHVVAPHYTTVTVQARLQAKPGQTGTELAEQARAKLAQFFHPLRGGPEGKGWPAGRAVYRSEVLALLQDIDGVAYVEALSLEKDGVPARCGNIEICRHGLVASGVHRIILNNRSHCNE